ncbi:MAG TPA: HEAT repeat domain-containing protein, partial [Phycisphaerae bacterium]|nr:HEAT repeat domain-containing protein [Phycisphaerae bacterium]
MTHLAAQLAGTAAVLLGSALVAAGPTDRTPAAPRVEPNAAPKAALPDTAPPTPEELRIRLGRCVDQRVADLASDDPQRCVQGQTALLGLARAYLDALSQYVDHDDLETRVRARDLLSHVLTETRVCRILLKLPPAQRAKLRELRKQEPGLFQEMLAKDWSRRVMAVRELAEPRRDPKHLAEPLLILSLQHPSAKLVSAAATAAGGGDYRSDAMVDALLALLVRHWDRYSDRQTYAYRGGDDGAPPNPATAALWALQELNSPRAVPGLLALLGKDPGSDMNRQIALAELIGAAGERRAIPVLIERLDRVAPRRPWHGADVRGTYTPADFAFLALLRLTGQAPSSYEFTYGHQNDRPFVAFATRARRRAAFAKFRQWWAQQKNNKPYQGLEPLEIPDLSTVGRFPQGGRTA